jgi:transcriptional regulator with XRE-family HTH domain
MDDVEPQVAARRERFSQVLDALEKQGLSQREIAMRACVPPQYFSDVKLGRRSLSELFARRLGEEFDVDHIWLMTGTGSMKRPRAWTADAETKRSMLIPILNQPIAGEPRQAPHWDGSLVELAGPAIPATAAAIMPYALRLADNDLSGRLKKGDIILISQSDGGAHDLAVLRKADALVLAWRKRGPKRYVSLQTGKPLAGDPEILGNGTAILWAPL